MLIATIIATSFLFAAIITIDFVSGLITLWENAGAKTQPPIEAKPAIEQPAIANQVQPASPLPDLWMQPVEKIAIALPTKPLLVRQQLLLPPAALQIATLEWTLRNLPPVEIYAVEIPDAIAMAKGRLPKTAQIVELATRQQLIDSGIRKCKKLASQLKVRRYNTMRLAALADVLVGKISLIDLAA